jgi:hypothetical protein
MNRSIHFKKGTPLFNAAMWNGLFTVIALIQTGCAGTVKLPNSDSTPPSVTLEVKVSGFATTVSSTGLPVTHHFAVFPVSLTAHGFDGDSGIKRVSIDGTLHWQCVDPSTSLAQSKMPLFHYQYDNPYISPKPGDSVLKELFCVADIQITEFYCQSPYVLSSGGIDVKATAENFYGGKSTTKWVHLIFP